MDDSGSPSSPREAIKQLMDCVQQSIIGQQDVIEHLMIALLTNGNVLMEGLPGLAKTRAIKTLSKHIESDFSRVQFTPDLLPSDVTGTEVYFSEGGSGEFRFQPGPIFGNLILADEINRAPAKVQAALLEALEERQVTVAGTTHRLPDLFMVLATQNPIEQEGTYPLPEAQMDRFLLHVYVDQPDDESEKKILRLVRGEESGSAPPSDARIPEETVFEARREVLAVQSADAIDDYLVALVSATRQPSRYSDDLARWIHVGVSPRATLALDRAARAKAWLGGRDHVIPDDVRAVAPGCLRHRLLLAYEANAEGVTADKVIAELLSQVAVGG
jgi:MoxR-like ATPase